MKAARFSHSLLLPFHLADAAGILFFGHAFTLAHQAFEAFITEGLQLPWKEWFQHPEWIVPIKHAEAQYHAPLYAGERCDIHLSVETIGSSSFVIRSCFTGEACHVKTVHVFCHRTQNKKMAIPSSIREALQAFC